MGRPVTSSVRAPVPLHHVHPPLTLHHLHHTGHYKTTGYATSLYAGIILQDLLNSSCDRFTSETIRCRVRLMKLVCWIHDMFTSWPWLVHILRLSPHFASWMQHYTATKFEEGIDISSPAIAHFSRSIMLSCDLGLPYFDIKSIARTHW